MASRPTKLDFKPLSLAETARQLHIPEQRARRLLSLIGMDLDTEKSRSLPIKGRATPRKTARKRKASR
jgi:hypothetical protein